ncbi:hypothetical protein CANMA_000527 [Candida margitis]|uniref:uncharacterized protein n=1 Tax=Candida margitis TaxID=1775924 RepID=UPI002227CE28|nr:uncharacterized protein CANMA_000527 [Candida margitis]KAI5970364.1 hypothetical protein CANMA_000527 [Candida margitis]
MPENVNVYVSGSYKNSPGGRDNHDGYAGIAVSCPVYPNMSCSQKLSELDHIRGFVVTPARVKLGSVVKGMQVILARLKIEQNKDIKFTLVSDCRNTVKYITKWGVHYVEKYGNKYSKWKNSKRKKVKDAKLLQTAMSLANQINANVKKKNLGGFELVYQKRSGKAKGSMQAWRAAQMSRKQEEQGAQRVEDEEFDTDDEYVKIDRKIDLS